jgi:hypothetical protein
MTPYLRTRRAVRPAILAQRLLAREQDRAGILAAECTELLALTRQLLIAAGHARLIDDRTELDDRAELDDRTELSDPPAAGPTLLDAYADAAMAWARVVGSLTALGGTLLDRGEWDEVRRVATALADAGEENAAADLRAQLGKAIWDQYHDQLRGIHARMTPPEIASSLATLRTVLHEVPEEFPDRNREVNRLLALVAGAIHALRHAQGAEIPLDSRVEHVAAGGVARYPEIVAITLGELTAEFEAL